MEIPQTHELQYEPDKPKSVLLLAVCCVCCPSRDQLRIPRIINMSYMCVFGRSVLCVCVRLIRYYYMLCLQ